MSANRSVSQEIADWIAGLTYDALPAEVRAEVRDGLINTIGTTIGGAGLPSVERAVEYASSQSGSGTSTVLVSGHRMSCSGTAFVNAVMANALGQEETHRVTGVHPIETTLPVLLAVAEERQSSGRDFLRSLAAGLEVTVALASMSLTPQVKYDACQAPAVYGTIGGAAALCSLMGLRSDQTANALGLAANFSAGLSECIRQGTGEYHYLKGLAATHAHLAAMLAASGVVSAPTAFEGDGGFFHLFAQVSREALSRHDVAGEVRESLGHRWGSSDLIYKPYPVHYFNQVFVDGALTLRSRHGLRPEDITSISIEVDKRATGSGAALKPPFARRENALGSTTFCVAAALARGRLTLHEISQVLAPDIVGLAELTTVSESAAPEAARVTVSTGDTFYEFDGLADGPDYRLRGSELYDIFHTAVTSTFDQSRSDQLLAALLDIESVDDVRALIPLTVAP